MKRILSLLLVVVSMLGVLSGCGGKENSEDPLAGYSNEELIQYAHELEAQSNQAYLQIEELKEQLTGIQGETSQSAAITEFSDNSGRLTLTTVDGMVNLPVGFEYPSSNQSYNVSSVSLTDNVYVKPSSNWTIALSGTQIDLYHESSKISGIIKVGLRDRTKPAVTGTDLDNAINTFFESMPQTTLVKGRIYLDDDWAGTDVQASSFVDEEDVRLRCGMLGLGDINITYMFSYKGQQDLSKDELILSLLQTMTVLNQPLRIE